MFGRGASMENNVRGFLEARGFDFSLLKSKVYCNRLFDGLSDRDREVLVRWLTEFAHQPFIKVETVSPALLTRMSSSDGIYLYWVELNQTRS